MTQLLWYLVGTKISHDDNWLPQAAVCIQYIHETIIVHGVYGNCIIVPFLQLYVFCSQEDALMVQMPYNLYSYYRKPYNM